MISALILPKTINDLTVDEMVTTALDSGLIACNTNTGAFRIAFFDPLRIPKGWSKFGFIDKNMEPPCAA